MRSKNHVISKSNIEFEFSIIAQGIYKFLWIKIILKDLKIQMKKANKDILW